MADVKLISSEQNFIHCPRSEDEMHRTDKQNCSINDANKHELIYTSLGLNQKDGYEFPIIRKIGKDILFIQRMTIQDFRVMAAPILEKFDEEEREEKSIGQPSFAQDNRTKDDLDGKSISIKEISSTEMDKSSSQDERDLTLESIIECPQLPSSETTGKNIAESEPEVINNNEGNLNVEGSIMCKIDFIEHKLNVSGRKSFEDSENNSEDKFSNKSTFDDGRLSQDSHREVENDSNRNDIQTENAWPEIDSGREIVQIPIMEVESNIIPNLTVKYFKMKVCNQCVVIRISGDTSSISVAAAKYMDSSKENTTKMLESTCPDSSKARDLDEILQCNEMRNQSTLREDSLEESKCSLSKSNLQETQSEERDDLHIQKQNVSNDDEDAEYQDKSKTTETEVLKSADPVAKNQSTNASIRFENTSVLKDSESCRENETLSLFNMTFQPMDTEHLMKVASTPKSESVSAKVTTPKLSESISGVQQLKISLENLKTTEEMEDPLSTTVTKHSPNLQALKELGYTVTDKSFSTEDSITAHKFPLKFGDASEVKTVESDIVSVEKSEGLENEESAVPTLNESNHSVCEYSEKDSELHEKSMERSHGNDITDTSSRKSLPEHPENTSGSLSTEEKSPKDNQRKSCMRSLASYDLNSSEVHDSEFKFPEQDSGIHNLSSADAKKESNFPETDVTHKGAEKNSLQEVSSQNESIVFQKISGVDESESNSSLEENQNLTKDAEDASPQDQASLIAGNSFEENKKLNLDEKVSVEDKDILIPSFVIEGFNSSDEILPKRKYGLFKSRTVNEEYDSSEKVSSKTEELDALEEDALESENDGCCEDAVGDKKCYSPIKVDSKMEESCSPENIVSEGKECTSTEVIPSDSEECASSEKVTSDEERSTPETLASEDCVSLKTDTSDSEECDSSKVPSNGEECHSFNEITPEEEECCPLENVDYLEKENNGQEKLLECEENNSTARLSREEGVNRKDKESDTSAKHVENEFSKVVIDEADKSYEQLVLQENAKMLKKFEGDYSSIEKDLGRIVQLEESTEDGENTSMRIARQQVKEHLDCQTTEDLSDVEENEYEVVQEIVEHELLEALSEADEDNEQFEIVSSGKKDLAKGAPERIKDMEDSKLTNDAGTSNSDSKSARNRENKKTDEIDCAPSRARRNARSDSSKVVIPEKSTSKSSKNTKTRFSEMSNDIRNEESPSSIPRGARNKNLPSSVRSKISESASKASDVATRRKRAETPETRLKREVPVRSSPRKIKSEERDTTSSGPSTRSASSTKISKSRTTTTDVPPMNTRRIKRGG